MCNRVQLLEKQYKQASKEKDLMEKKMQRLEKSRDAETQELREKLNSAQRTVAEQVCRFGGPVKIFLNWQHAETV